MAEAEKSITSSGTSDIDQTNDMSPEALHKRMLKKQLWIVMSKAMKAADEVPAAPPQLVRRLSGSSPGTISAGAALGV